jgi:Domain of unknown function (DUF3395)
VRITSRVLGVVAVLTFSALAVSAQQTWYVQSADWGAGNRRQDVTNTVRRLVNGPNFRANNQNMGVDPYKGADKTLRIIGRDQSGRVQTFNYKEGATVNSSMFVSKLWGGGGGWNGGGDKQFLRIVRGTYSSGRNSRDVTSQLQSMVVNNRLNIVVNNQTMGGDPAPGQQKVLQVQYEYNGSRQSRTVSENSRLILP